MNILQFIASSNFITVNKEIIKKLGLEEAILLGELASEFDYWSKRNELDDGYFYSTIENIEENTTLTRFKQDKAIKKLKQLGILEVKVKGIPARRYIKINEGNLYTILSANKNENNLQPSLQITYKLECEPVTCNNNIYNNNNNNNNKKKDISKDISKEKEKKVTNPDKEINKKIEAYTTNEMLRQTIKDFVVNRKENKSKITNLAMTRLLNKLDKLALNDSEKISILNQSIINNWKDIYAIKKGNVPGERYVNNLSKPKTECYDKLSMYDNININDLPPEYSEYF